MDIKYSIIPHVHWDREWYFSQQKSLLYLLHDLDEAIDTLENDASIPYFLFDAQTSLISDYLSYHGHQKDRLLKLIREKRILTGPWYTQCDQMIIHGESIVRNLLYGTTAAEQFGHCFRVGYAVDCFGQAAQMPQIYKGFKIPFTIFKRGIETAKIPSSEFVWRSDDGSEVFAYHCQDYMNFRNPSNDATKNMAAIKKMTESYQPRSKSGTILLFNGFDQHPIRSDIANIVRDMDGELKLEMEPLEMVLDQMAQTADLPRYTGELNSGETGRVHKSIYSSRADIKRLNSQCENLMIRIIEPLQVLLHDLTGQDERELLKPLWKMMMENSAHDAIGTCNSDEVNRQIKERFLIVQDYLRQYEALSYRKIARQVASDDYALQVYNYLPVERTDQVETTILAPYPQIALQDSRGNSFEAVVLESEEVSAAIKTKYAFVKGVDGNYSSRYENDTIYRLRIKATVTVPALGYETFHVLEATPTDLLEKSLENEYLKVTINTNGTLRVYDKIQDYEYDQLMVIEDDADAGDSYDWSSTDKDRLITSWDALATDVKVAGNQANYQITLMLPQDLEGRARGEDEYQENVAVELTLLDSKAQLDFKVKIDNKVTDHRMRVRFDVNLPSTHSFADQTFGTIKRPTYLPEVETWRDNNWSEKPRTIEPMQSYVYLTDGTRTVGLISDSVKEYQITGSDCSQISYTLFRSFPKMGRADLDDRPGRASGKEWPTPDAMLLTTVESTFALCFPQERSHVADYAGAYTTPLRVHQEAIVATSSDEFILRDQKQLLPSSHSILELTGPATKMSILKLAETGDDYILRTYQLEAGTFTVKSKRQVADSDLDEIAERKFESDKIRKSNEITTIKLKK